MRTGSSAALKITPSDKEMLQEWILNEAQQDVIGLWFIISWAEEFEEEESHAIRVLVSEALRELIQQRKIVVGQYTADGLRFFLWYGTATEIMDFVMREWRILKRAPSVAEIAWFTSPDFALAEQGFQ